MDLKPLWSILSLLVLFNFNINILIHFSFNHFILALQKLSYYIEQHFMNLESMIPYIYVVSSNFSCLLSDPFWVSLFLLHVLLLVWLLGYEGCKEIICKEDWKRRKETQDIFYILTLLIGSTTIQLVKKLFLNPNEIAVSPKQGVKMY